MPCDWLHLGSSLTACPLCGCRNGAATELPDGMPPRPPVKDDASICLSCAGVSLFTGVGLNVRLATAVELVEMLADASIVAAVCAVREANETHAAPGR